MSDYTLRPRGAFYELRLTRPPLNVLNILMMQGMVSELEEATTRVNQSHGLIISAEGKAFSAGVDVGDHMGEKASDMLRKFHRLFHIMNRLEVPTIALVQGAALGGGCELAMGCDLVLASETAQFAQPEIRVGVFPPIAAIVLPELIGWRRAMKFLLTGESITARTAWEWGLVNDVFPAAEFSAGVEKILGAIAALSRPVLSYTLRAVGRRMDSDTWTKRVGELETMYLNGLMHTHDAQEGLAAFLGKRQPQWTHQ